MKIFICNGLPQSGKTTFQNLCKHLYKGNVHIISTVDFVKYVASVCGWDNKKTPKNRKFLSDLKDLLTQWNDVPYKKVVEVAEHLRDDRFCCANDWILFVDCREPAQIQKLKEGLNATTVLVRRLGDKTSETSNHADANVFDYEYDYVIKNYGDLSDLVAECVGFLDYMKERNFYVGNY